MAGLLDGVLPAIYSASNSLKRRVSGLLGDPMGTLAQTAGLIQDERRNMQALDAQAFANPARPFAVTDKAALGQMIDKTMNGPMGFAPIGIMAGVNAKTADKAALKVAQEMEARKVSPDVIWNQTGWGKGPDGKWRFEIDDSAARFNNPYRKPTPEEVRLALDAQDTVRSIDAARDEARKVPGFNIADFYKQRPGDYEKWVDARKKVSAYEKQFKFENQGAKSGSASDFVTHQGLFDAYPALGEIPTTYNPRHSGGAYRPEMNNMLVGGGDEKSIALHELQHAIQKREGFANGGAPESMLQKALQMLRRDVASGEISSTEQAMSMLPMYQQNVYERLAGEAEARMVQSRMNMTPEQRAAQFPWAADYFNQATGVPIDSLLFR